MKRFLLLMAFSFAINLCFSARSQRITAEVFFKQEEKTDFKIAPDGQYISFIGHKGNHHNLFIQDVKTDQITQLTFDSLSVFPSWNWYEPYYWLDTERIVFCKEKANAGKRIYLVNIKDKKQRCLTDFENSESSVVSIRTNLPDVIMISSDAQNKAGQDLFRLNVQTGEMQLVYKNPGGNKVYFTKNDGTLGIVRTREGVYIYDETRKEVEQIVDHKVAELFVPMLFSSDNKILYAFSAANNDKFALVEYDMNKRKERVLLQDPINDLYSREERNDEIRPTADITYSYGLKKLIAVNYCTEQFNTHIFDADVKSSLERIKKRIGDYNLKIESSTENMQAMILKASSDKTKGQYYYYNQADGTLKLIHRMSSWLDEKQMAEVKPVSYKSIDDKLIHGYLTIPSKVKLRNLPLVVYTHGGPWLRDTPGYSDISQFFANRGYLVLEVNYRGSTGYGIEFQTSGYKQLGLKMQDDITAGVEWLIKEGMVDKSKVAIYGFSSGGLNVLAGLAFTPRLYACGISISGIVHQINSWENKGPLGYDKFGDPVKDSTLLKNASPYFFVENIKAPLLMAYGVKDGGIPIKDVDVFVEKLKKQGTEVEYLRYDNLGHNILYNREQKIVIFKKMEILLDRCFNKK